MNKTQKSNPKNRYQDYAIHMDHITKFFGSLKANDAINLYVKKNTIHALMGENGAGKTTLMSILFGLYPMDNGIIRINGNPVEIGSPAHAHILKIGMVHQHFRLVPNYKVWQNIALGNEKVFAKLWINKKAIIKKIKALCILYNLEIDLNATVANISVSMQQRVEILKLLYWELNILIFDEPTAVLRDKEIDDFLAMLQLMKKNGKTIVFITHKINEIFKSCDVVTVIKNGTFVARRHIKETNPQEITVDMFGHPPQEVVNQEKTTHTQDQTPILSLKAVTTHKIGNRKLNGLDKVSLDVYPGEVLAIAGIADNGQNELDEVINGVRKVTKGYLFFNGIDVTKQSVFYRKKIGLSSLPEDRSYYGALMSNNLFDNVLLTQYRRFPFSDKGILRNFYVQSYVQNLIRDYDVAGAQAGFALFGDMSGGNQQKLMLGRELDRSHNLILMNQPTRGLDLSASFFIREQIIKEKQNKNGVLLISYDLNEIINLATRILVISKGQIVKEFEAKNTNIQEIGRVLIEHEGEQAHETI